MIGGGGTRHGEIREKERERGHGDNNKKDSDCRLGLEAARGEPRGARKHIIIVNQ